MSTAATLPRKRLAATFAALLLLCGLATTYYLQQAQRHVGADYTSMVTDVIRAQASIKDLPRTLEQLYQQPAPGHYSLQHLQKLLKRIERRSGTVRHSLLQSELADTDYRPQLEEIRHAETQLSEMLHILEAPEVAATENTRLIRLGSELEQTLAWTYSELNEMLHLASADQRRLMQWLSTAVITLLLLVGLVLGGLMMALMRIHQQNETLRHQSQTDALTGLCNRRRMYQVAEQELVRLQRSGGSLGLVLIDLDHFKRINDTHGHPIGDAVLKAFATLLSQQVRETDLAVRMGGEEFAVVMPDSDADAAYALAERIRKATLILKLPHQLKLTVSLGAGATREPTDTFEQVFSRTDKLLYCAKTRGRNRTERDN